MIAFIQTEHGLFKVYDQGSDWQIIGPCFERWFSKWTADPTGSLMRAIDAIPSINKSVVIV